jgi:hypothetical protein
VFFDISRDQDLAAVEVQNAVKLAEVQLPEEVRRQGIVIQKANSNILGGALISEDPRYDASYLTNYAKLYVEDELKRLPGVGNAQVFGGLEFSMLLSLDPGRWPSSGSRWRTSRGRCGSRTPPTPPGGSGGAGSLAPSSLCRHDHRAAHDAREFGSIIVRARPDGSLSGAGPGESAAGALSYEAVGGFGRPTTFILGYARPGANNLGCATRSSSGWTSCAGSPSIRWVLP